MIQVFARPSMIGGTTDYVCLCPMDDCRCLSLIYRITIPTVQMVCHGYAGGGGGKLAVALRRAAGGQGPPASCAAPARLLGAPRACIRRLSVCLSVCLSQYLPVQFTASVAALRPLLR